MFDALFTTQVWRQVYLGNSLKDYLLAFITFAIFLVALELSHKLALGRLLRLSAKSKNRVIDFVVVLINRFGPSFYIWFSGYMAAKTLIIHPTVGRAIDIIMIIWAVAIIISIGEKIITYLISRHFDKDNQSKSFLYIMSFIIKLVLWIFGGVMILSNLGINVTALITGLGISGVAIALALQTILGDLFSSFAIYLDKPFKPGDFITVGTESGFVQKIGIKTTRILGLAGQTIIISNKELTNTHIQNFHKLAERQAKLQIHLPLETSDLKCKKALAIMREAVISTNRVKFDHANIIGLTDHSLLCDIGYAVTGPDMQLFLDCQQEIILKTKEALKKEGIQPATPIQRVMLSK